MQSHTAPGSDSVPAGTLPGDETAAADSRRAPGEAAAPSGARPPKVFKVWDFVAVFVGGQIGGLIFATVGYAISGDEVDTGRRPRARLRPGQYLAYGILVWLVCRRRGTGSPAPGSRAVRAAPGLVGACRSAPSAPSGSASSCCRLRHFIDQNQGVVDDLSTPPGAKLAVIVIAAGMLAPIFEELVFRGLLLPRARPHGRPTGRSRSAP